MKNRIFIAIIAFIIIEAASFLYIENLYKSETAHFLNDKTNEFLVKQKAVRVAYNGMIDIIFQQIISKPNVLSLYNQALSADSTQRIEIRDSLYHLLLPTYEQLKLTNIRQFIFIMPNNEVFIRFHRLDKYGDDLTDIRYSVKTANATLQKQIGFEEGRTYNGFRNIFPIFYNNKHIGVIEISYSFAINQLLKHDGGSYGLMIKNEIVKQKISPSLKDNYITSLLSDNYMHETKFLHYKQDTINGLKYIDRNIKTIIAEKINQNENFTIHHQYNQIDYLISFISITNVEGTHVGYMFSYHRDNKVLAEYKQKTIKEHIIFSILYAILIFVILLVSIKKAKLKELDRAYKEKERKILDTFKDGVYVSTSEYKISYANSSLQKTLGINPIGQDCFKAIHNLEDKCSWCIYDKLKHEERIEYELLKDDDKTYLVNNILFEEGDKLTILKDITERKRAENALKKNEEHLRLAQNAGKIGTWEWEIKTDKLIWSDMTYKIFGIDQRVNKITGERFFSYIHSDDKKRIIEELDISLKNKTEKHQTEYRIIINDKIKWINETSKIITESGEFVRMIGILHDITDRKKAEEEIRILSSAVEQSPATIVITDLEGNIEFTNSVFTNLTGYLPEEAVGKNPNILKSGHTTSDEYKELWDIISTGKTWQGEFLNIKKNNEEYWENAIISSIKNDKGEITNYLAIKEDITAKKKIEQALKESNKAKDKFFSIIAHDLKSPFNSMLGFSNILASDYDNYNAEERKHFIEIIHKGLQNTYKLLENLLLWSRTQQGTIKFHPEKENLYLLSKETIELLKLSCNRKSINIKNEIPTNIFVEADKYMLATIIRNLISNAIKFTPRNGEIIISAQKIIDENDMKFAEITVEDNGLGISETMKTKLFNISESMSTLGTENEKGTGLGLILCKEFTEKHGGSINVESEVSKGSKFTFTIPTSLITV